MWRSEKLFGQYILRKLKAQGFDTFRVETGMTTVGMPDVYAMGGGADWWIELKNMQKSSIKSAYWRVPWRSGQQMWALSYWRCLKGRKCSWTFVGLKDGVLIVRMGSLKEDNIVRAEDKDAFVFSLADFAKLNLGRWLIEHA